MTRKSNWPKGVEIQRSAIALPRRTWEASKVQAMKENRTFQEVVAEALEDYLRNAKKRGDRR